MRRDPRYNLNHGYSRRALGCLAAALLLMIGLFRWWPALPSDEGPPPEQLREQEVIELAEIQQTRQGHSVPPPPAPIPPVAVPDEIVLQDVPLDLEPVPFSSPTSLAGVGPPGLPEGTGSEGGVYVSPKLMGFTLPESTREMRRHGIKAELRIRVLVDGQGGVRSMEILNRYLLSGDGQSKQQVDEIGYGAEESILAALERARFQPARLNGQPVEGNIVVVMGSSDR